MNRSRFARVPRTFDFADLGVIPRSLLNEAHRMTVDAVIWSALEWGLPSEQFVVFDHMPMSAVREQFRAWEEQSDITVEEILGLLSAIDKYGMEIEYDLIKLGLRLRDFPSPSCTWRDLCVILRMSQPHDRFYQSVNPKGAQWDLTNFLLAEVVDSLRWLQWAKTESAKDASTAPKPIPRPNVTTADESDANGLRGRKMPLEKAKERFDRPDPDRQKKLYGLFH